LTKCCCAAKHFVHVCNCANVPWCEILVESSSTLKQLKKKSESKFDVQQSKAATREVEVINIIRDRRKKKGAEGERTRDCLVLLELGP
jgi:hypothetical protein